MPVTYKIEESPINLCEDGTIQLEVVMDISDDVGGEGMAIFYANKPNWIERLIGITRKDKWIKARKKAQQYIAKIEKNQKESIAAMSEK